MTVGKVFLRVVYYNVAIVAGATSAGVSGGTGADAGVSTGGVTFCSTCAGAAASLEIHSSSSS